MRNKILLTILALSFLVLFLCICSFLFSGTSLQTTISPDSLTPSLLATPTDEVTLPTMKPTNTAVVLTSTNSPPARQPTPALTPLLVATVTPIHTPIIYDCSGDIYNCSNFSGNFQEYLKQCGNDLSKLDGDKDGDACEGN